MATQREKVLERRLDKRTPFRTLGVAQSEQEVHHAFDQGNGSAREALPFAR